MYHDISRILCSFREYLGSRDRKEREEGRRDTRGIKKFPDDFSENTWLDCMARSGGSRELPARSSRVHLARASLFDRRSDGGIRTEC